MAPSAGASAREPIVAIATAPGRGAVGIVRISGAQLDGFAQALLQRPGRPLAPREATYLPFPGAQGEPLDQGLALFFPAPRSYTGEDVLELQAHGGPVVLQLLLARCLAVAAQPAASGLPLLPNLRLARPGEFTERAFLNGKLDLAQAEAVADLIDASTEAAARSAGRSLGGAFAHATQTLRDELVALRTLVEATLDFPEEDIDFIEAADVRGRITRVADQLGRVQRQATQGSLLRDGLKVVIAGRPNAGKSSLLNALAGAELAIVTPIPGTTRDVLSHSLQIHGVPLHVVDTAGLRVTDDVVERIGVQRAWAQIGQADVVLLLQDLSDGPSAAVSAIDSIAGYADLMGDSGQNHPQPSTVLRVFTKADLAAPSVWAQAQAHGCVVSSHTGHGLDALRDALVQAAGWQADAGGVFMARQRHLQALGHVGQALRDAQTLLSAPAPALDLLAEELRRAQHHLGEITGDFTSDDLLGAIFSTFCIGK
jgi:tRNA modification GTPase